MNDGTLATLELTEEIDSAERRIEIATDAIKINPSDPVYYIARAGAHVDLGDFEAALEDLETARHWLPAEGDELSDEEAVRVRTQRAAVDLTYVGIQMRLKNYGEVIDLLETHSMVVDDHNVLLMFQLARCYQKSGLPTRAISLFTRVIQQTPQQPQAFEHRGILYYAAELYHEALADFNTVIGLQPEHFNAHFMRSRVHYQLGDLNATIDDCNRASAIDPTSPLPYLHLVRAYDDMGERYASEREHNRSLYKLAMLTLDDSKFI